ncbi:Claudin-17 [Larimichthys crocea]|uniref:Claudin n=1 Tax=Larimichthys crocea TaxID=215358 RepID=A0A6G0IU99_LARCR|nr:claudin-17 [Larimichthys crocea]KAE8295099.1 Claudin-17 [Larimichthys crocea]
MRAKLEVLALVLGFIGLIGTITVTALPMWRVSAFIGANLIVMEELWEGLWMNCYRQADIKMQCKVYDSLLILPSELQAARGFMCVSIVLVVISLIITGCGTKKSNCCGDNMRSKNITLAIGGSFFLLSFLTTIIPVSWVGHTIISRFYNPNVVDSQKRELGEALFIGWGTSGILLITGIILLLRYCKRSSKDEEPYSDAYLMAATDIKKEESVHLERKPSSFYKTQEYV